MSPATADLLNHVRVASPCTADWDAMRGDASSRFCDQCQKHVYNLSAMPAERAVELIREKEGSLCVRLYVRKDGTVLADDCPIGARRVAKRLRQLAWAGAAALGLSAGTLLLPNLVAAEGRPVHSEAMVRLSQTFHDLVYDIREWLGLTPPGGVVAGALAMPPMPPPGPGFVLGEMACPTDGAENGVPEAPALPE